MRRSRRSQLHTGAVLTGAALVGAVLAVRAPALAAQQRAALGGKPPGIDGPLSLGEALRRALRDGPDLLRSAAAAEAALGVAISARAAFDAVVQSSLVHSRVNALSVVPGDAAGGAPAVTSVLTSAVTSTVSLSQRVPWGGLIVTPQVSVTSAGSPGATALARATSALDVTVPLARDRMGRLSQQVVDASSAEATAAGLDLRQAAATSAQQAADAYWTYVAARHRLEVSLAAEQRAQTNLAQTSELVAADERPAADLVQLRGNLATRLATRIAAEQAVLDAWRTLAALLGQGDAGIIRPPATSSEFPALPDSAALRVPLDERDRQALIDDALRRRADLAASITRLHEFELDVHAADQLLRPVVNLDAQVGFSGLNMGRGVQNFFSPLYRHRSPLNASVQLSYQFAPRNSDAAGQLRQAAAELEAQRITRGAITREVATGVVVAVEGVRRAITAARAAHLATEAARQSVDDEWRKFRLGSATVFDITLAEDGLTNAELGEVGARQSYATAIVRFQFELGMLVIGDREHAEANVDGLLRAPAIVAGP